MASFSLKRISFGATSNRGRRATMNDAAMTGVLNAYRTAFGKISDGAGGVRDMTDDEVTDKMFDDAIQRWMNKAAEGARDVAAAAATSAIQVVVPTTTQDNT